MEQGARLRGWIAAVSAAVLMALAPAGALACAQLASRHAPVPVACEFVASLARSRARAGTGEKASARQRVAVRSFIRAAAPDAPAPWSAPSSPAPSQAPPRA